MASLSGTKIKDTYNTLLKLESGPITTSTKIVEDGLGNDSALKISTNTVETTGDLKISGTPGTTTSDTKALMLSTSGVIVTRDLNSSPIGTTTITANSPLSATGSTVELKDPSGLAQITTPATNDKYLIWDESTSAYKYIEQDDLANSISTIISGLQPQEIVARMGGTAATTAIATSPTDVVFAPVLSTGTVTGAATSSVMFGPNTNNIFQLTNTTVTNDSVTPGENTGQYEITAVMQIEGGSATNMTVELIDSYNSVTVLATGVQVVQNGTNHILQFSHVHYYNFSTDSGLRLQLRVTGAEVGSKIVKKGTYLKVRALGDNITF
mgnify:CR=1 FL=1|tara:strand:- start:1712 stop:2686 length:975 start_codon:yes stop_codon:yes gene_type:complete